MNPLPPEIELAVVALCAAIMQLPPLAAHELVRRVQRGLGNDAEHASDGRSGRAERSRRFAAAIRTLADELGHTPTSTEYRAAHRETRAQGRSDMPSLSAIVKHFGGWALALAAAGLEEGGMLTRTERRRRYQPKRLAKYPRSRLIECLRACAEALGRVPTIRDYAVWRDEAVKRAIAAGFGADVPHRRTIESRFGGWRSALGAAGLSPKLDAKAAAREWSKP